jgi:LmbE family N-acetylglucosaminyl deacetylase
LRSILILLAASALLTAQDTKLRVIAFGAHPDDCDIRASGTAALFASMGHAVKFVSVTNGDAGHQSMKGPALAARRHKEASESARRLGISYDVLENHDGELLPTLQVRQQIIREIRGWNADIVLAPRPNDYHPDHRYTGVLVQDAAYMVVVPSVTPDVPALRKNPVFLYYEDRFQRPNPFRPDIAVRLDEVIDKKIEALDSHVSQFYEWLPWVDGRLKEVPAGAAERKVWLKKDRTRPPSDAVRASLVKWYGASRGTSAQYYEAFEICEYGTQPDDAGIRKLFPMLHE